eukprot:scaffold191214_cov31-Tisochrysis_lutea.AAC.2
MPMSPSTSGSSPVLSPPMVLAVGEVVSRTLRPCSMVEKRVVTCECERECRVRSSARPVSAEPHRRQDRPCSGLDPCGSGWTAAPRKCPPLTSSFDAPAGAAGDGRVSTASSDVSAASQAWRNGTRCDRPKSCVWTASLSTTYVNRHGECVQGVGAALPALAPPVAFGAGCTSSVAEMRLPSDAMATDVTREACGCPAPLATSCRACACWRGSWREIRAHRDVGAEGGRAAAIRSACAYRARDVNGNRLALRVGQAHRRLHRADKVGHLDAIADAHVNMVVPKCGRDGARLKLTEQLWVLPRPVGRVKLVDCDLAREWRQSGRAECGRCPSAHWSPSMRPPRASWGPLTLERDQIASECGASCCDILDAHRASVRLDSGPVAMDYSRKHRLGEQTEPPCCAAPLDGGVPHGQQALARPPAELHGREATSKREWCQRRPRLLGLVLRRSSDASPDYGRALASGGGEDATLRVAMSAHGGRGAERDRRPGAESPYRGGTRESRQHHE